MKVYLDVCCLNRPFDDQDQERIRAEADAVNSILRAADEGRIEYVGSQMSRIEASNMKDLDRRRRVLALLPKVLFPLDDVVAKRARELMSLGLKAADATHVAAGEALAVDVLLTTDDRLENAGRRLADRLRIRVVNVLSFYEESRHAIDG